MRHSDKTYKIIGCAHNVYNQLGFGFLESVYQKALLHELNKAGFAVETEKSLKVTYDGVVVGDFYIDLLVDNEVVIELKSVKHMIKEHEMQLVNYLNAIRKDINSIFQTGLTRLIRYYSWFPEETMNTSSPSARSTI
jgi:GxxExxY protein